MFNTSIDRLAHNDVTHGVAVLRPKSIAAAESTNKFVGPTNRSHGVKSRPSTLGLPEVVEREKINARTLEPKMVDTILSQVAVQTRSSS